MNHAIARGQLSARIVAAALLVATLSLPMGAYEIGLHSIFAGIGFETLFGSEAVLSLDSHGNPLVAFIDGWLTPYVAVNPLDEPDFQCVDTSGPKQDWLSLAVSDEGEIHVLYRHCEWFDEEINGEHVRSELRYATQANNGSWTTEDVVEAPGETLIGRIFLSETGRPAALVENGDALVLYRRVGEDNWLEETITDTRGGCYVVFSVLHSNGITFVLFDSYSQHTGLHELRVGTLTTDSWREETIATAPWIYANPQSMALGWNGELHIAYSRGDSWFPGAVAVHALKEGTDWAESRIVSDAMATVGGIAIDSEGTPYVVLSVAETDAGDGLSIPMSSLLAVKRPSGWAVTKLLSGESVLATSIAGPSATGDIYAVVQHFDIEGALTLVTIRRSQP